MIKPNDFSSAGRQDDLLKRLKECVGSIQSGTKDTRVVSSKRQSQKFPSKQLIFQQPIKERKYQNRQSYRQSVQFKQNRTDSKHYPRQQDFRQSTHHKQNPDILKLTKNYLQNTQQNSKQYRPDRKQALLLGDASNISNIKKELFSQQSSQKKPFSGFKDVSESTKKRIAEREYLINDQTHKITPQKVLDSQRNKFNEDQFLQRLSLRKVSYLNESNPTKQRNLSINNEGIAENRRASKQFQRMNEEQNNHSTSLRQKQSDTTFSSRIPVQKYQNYSKKAMQNLVKDNDFKKAEKMQKLKKITDMNDEINKRIRKIVDNFQNYLTHRE